MSRFGILSLVQAGFVSFEFDWDVILLVGTSIIVQIYATNAPNRPSNFLRKER